MPPFGQFMGVGVKAEALPTAKAINMQIAMALNRFFICISH
jgi:hypothetical protein